MFGCNWKLSEDFEVQFRSLRSTTNRTKQTLKNVVPGRIKSISGSKISPNHIVVSSNLSKSFIPMLSLINLLKISRFQIKIDLETSMRNLKQKIFSNNICFTLQTITNHFRLLRTSFAYL